MVIQHHQAGEVDLLGNVVGRERMRSKRKQVVFVSKSNASEMS